MSPALKINVQRDEKGQIRSKPNRNGGGAWGTSADCRGAKWGPTGATSGEHHSFARRGHLLSRGIPSYGRRQETHSNAIALEAGELRGLRVDGDGVDEEFGGAIVFDGFSAGPDEVIRPVDEEHVVGRPGSGNIAAGAGREG